MALHRGEARSRSAYTSPVAGSAEISASPIATVPGATRAVKVL